MITAERNSVGRVPQPGGTPINTHALAGCPQTPQEPGTVSNGFPNELYSVWLLIDYDRAWQGVKNENPALFAAIQNSSPYSF
ncbi:MAG: hypothetical protein JWM99_2149 [Verrucomicrobiales bacterium]|jgi:hypothetical protein|nr:hypothetical protein [Verrucomicrobiales bacterium]